MGAARWDQTTPGIRDGSRRRGRGPARRSAVPAAPRSRTARVGRPPDRRVPDPPGDGDPPAPDVRGRGLRRADRLDGAHAPGLPQGDRLPNCRFPFVIGIDEDGRSGRPVCPNCGQDGLGEVPAVECNGDRLLVQKFLFDLRRPGRWEVAVFHSPAEPDQAYVKRVVGLPGEAIQIADGDVVIDGRIARKTLGRAAGHPDPGLRQRLPAGRLGPLPALDVPGRPVPAVGRDRLEGGRDRVRPRPDGDFGRPRGLARIPPLGPRAGPVRAGPRLLPLQRGRCPGREPRSAT